MSKLDLQIKSKKIVTEHGEIFTNEKEVKTMVDLIDDETLTQADSMNEKTSSYPLIFKSSKEMSIV